MSIKCQHQFKYPTILNKYRMFLIKKENIGIELRLQSSNITTNFPALFQFIQYIFN